MKNQSIPFASAAEIQTALPFPLLIDKIKKAFAQNRGVTPLRHHHDYQNPTAGKDSTLLLMPSWVPGESLGIKVVTVSPNNSKHNLPAIQGIYLLFDAVTGTCKLLLDAKSLTVRRTAATSALASSFLSRADSSVLLMVGTGALAPELVRAHASMRPIKKVLVWGRNPDHAQVVCESLSGEKFTTESISSLEDGIRQADIISCATLSETPLIMGQYLREGQHIDLVGAYQPNMREADDETIRRAQIFVDHYAGALHETGDLVIPIREGILKAEEIKAELHELCCRSKPGRTSHREITLFKSVGHALEDLVAAELVFKTFNAKTT